MKTSWTERELADVYAGAEDKTSERKFSRRDMLNYFLRFIAKHSPKYPKLMLDERECLDSDSMGSKTSKKG